MSRPASLLKLEQDAYYAVLRALAVNDLDWTKEKLLTDLRKVLNISNDMHFKFLEEVMEDKLVLRLQDSRNNAPAAPSSLDMPPPPRQQPAAYTASGQRKPGRPPSANLKQQASLTSPLGQRTTRGAEPTASGGDRRGRPPKRDRDEGFEPPPRRPSLTTVKSIKTSLAPGRSRGRGRRISGLTREAVQAQQVVVASKYKLVPFGQKFLQDKMESGTPGDLEEMHTALLLRDQGIQQHLDLIQQLEDDVLATTDPPKYCQLLIRELELADERLTTELGMLHSDDEMEVDLQVTQTEDSVAAFQSKSAVKVAVVVRPLLAYEQAKSATDVVELIGGSIVKVPQKVYLGGAGSPPAEAEKLQFDYDRVYRGSNITRQLFIELTVPLLRQYLNGFNATVFAYGQTGSGKTYTMGTAATAKQMRSLQEESLIPRAIKLLFDTLATMKQEYSVILKMSYVQIHEDRITDLLVEQVEARAPSITLREHPTKGVYMENAKENEVSNLADVAQALEEGNGRRAVAAHNLNEFSSRSHAVLQLTLEQRRKPNAPADPSKHKFLQGKLNLVDLAGSERAKETGTAGQQFNEGVQINKGLLALGNVIGALTEGSARKHIPYRDSKLTRILQDSLGGTSETLMVACVSPGSINLEQTINTLRYASRARSIQNRLKLNNKYSLEDELAFLKKTLAEKDALIQQLQREVAGLKSGGQSAPSAATK